MTVDGLPRDADHFGGESLVAACPTERLVHERLEPLVGGRQFLGERR